MLHHFYVTLISSQSTSLIEQAYCIRGEVHDYISANFVILIALFILFCRNMSFKATLIDFCSSTSIHGLGFIANEKSSLVQRLGWLFIFLCSLSYATINLKQATESKLKKGCAHLNFSQLLMVLFAIFGNFWIIDCTSLKILWLQKQQLKEFSSCTIRVILQLIVSRDFRR